MLQKLCSQPHRYARNVKTQENMAFSNEHNNSSITNSKEIELHEFPEKELNKLKEIQRYKII